MVDSVVTFLLNNLSQLLASEARLISGVEDRVSSLQNKLQLIDAFLKDNDGNKSKKEMEKVVGKQIREVAEEAEDVIDTFVTNMTMHKRRSKLGRMIHGGHHAKLHRDVSQQIDRINAKITEIFANMKDLNLFQQEGESSSTREEEKKKVQQMHERRRNVEENDVVGFMHDSKEIIQRLKNEGSMSNVVSIVGMGGLGKTTLARKVYNSPEVKQHFDCRAWVYVSNDCRVKELFLGLLKCLNPNLEHESARSKKKGKKKKGIEKVPQDLSNLSVQDLKQMVHECLKRKKYLLVLDDLWEKDDWDVVQDTFPKDNIGSKILITSRSKEVASHTSKDPPYPLQVLNEEESWELFSKRVFCTEECPSDLEPLGKQIVKSCQGLPLSIIVLAGLLSNKEKSKREWSKVVGHVNSYLTQDKTQVNIILKLSYDNLPNRLKSCFLYFGIFPEDFEINVKGLLHQWVAEGFIQETGTRSLEDVAEDYLYELIDRSLVQVARVKLGSRGVKTCRIHDLLRDLCISESKEDRVFEVCTDNNIQGKTKPRRLSVHCEIPRYVSSSMNDHSCVRSLFYFGPIYDHDPTEQKRLFKSFKLLRVFDLGLVHCERLFYNARLFIHLRYLRICHSTMDIFVPDSICILQSLQTLDFYLVHQGRISFPGRLWKLTQLRHLYTNRLIELRDYHPSKADDKVMWNLQTISSILLNRQSSYLFEKVRFPELRKLELKINSPLRKGERHKLLSSLQHSSHLNKLHVALSLRQFKKSRRSSSDMDMVHEVFQSMQQLEPDSTTFVIYNASDFLTRAVEFPSSLTKLSVCDITCMNDDGMKALGNLTNLRVLIIWHSMHDNDDGFELNCIAGGFPQLRVFQMEGLNVSSWKLTNGAMPRLQSLVIGRCTRLDSIPNEVWSLTALRYVQVWNPSEALSIMLRNLEMKNGCELTIEYSDWNK